MTRSNNKAIGKPDWCLSTERELSMKDLVRLKDKYQHLLGLCYLGIELKKTEGWIGYLKKGVNDRHWIIGASNERILLHELLELLLLQKKVIGKEMVIFCLTNAILKLKEVKVWE